MSNQFVFANNVQTTLASPLSSSGTVLVLSSSANLPSLSAGQVLPITLNDAATGLVYEVCYVTAIAGTSLTVIRAQEGTGAQNWAVGDHAFCDQTAQSTAAKNGDTTQTFGGASPAALTDFPNVNTIQIRSVVKSIDSGSVNTYAITLSPAPTALTAGMEVGIENILNTNTGASTLAVNAIGSPLPIQSSGGIALQGNELMLGYGATFRLNHAGTAWILTSTTGGNFPVKPATKTEHSINLGQGTAGSVATDVTASRAFATTYTNSSARAIYIYAAAAASNGAAGLTGYINGVAVAFNYVPVSGVQASIGLFVPPTATYEVSVTTGSLTLDKWIEVL